MKKAWERVLLTPDTPISEAIRILNDGALRIALVTNPDRKLLGILTDGDLRRGLLHSCDMRDPVSSIMCSSPTLAHRSWSRAKMLAIMEENELLQLPVVDENQRLVSLETLHGLLHKPRRTNPVFLMAGGFGKRLRPLTNDCPKPMLRIGEKPILELIIQGFLEAGFHHFYISTHYKAEQIREYFGDGSDWNAKITYLHEDAPLGTGGALSLLPKDAIGEPIFMMNGDLLTNIDYLELLDFHEANGPIATICTRAYEQTVPYGVIQTKDDEVVEITEKPRQLFNVSAGVYLLSPGFLNLVESGSKIDMPDLFNKALLSQERICSFPLKNYWLDIGRPDDFAQAQTDIDELIDFSDEK